MRRKRRKRRRRALKDLENVYQQNYNGQEKMKEGREEEQMAELRFEISFSKEDISVSCMLWAVKG